MAKQPKKTSGPKLFNIIEAVRGNFGSTKAGEDTKPVAYGSKELISQKTRSAILARSLDMKDPRVNERSSQSSLLALIQPTLSKVSADRLENRRIMQLMPEVDKAARLMVASIFSPNDLSRQEIPVVFDIDGIPDDYRTKLNDFATGFFQKKLNLKTSAPNWVYQFGYESGAATFAVIPLMSFSQVQDESFLGTESLVSKVVQPLIAQSVFGFGDGDNAREDYVGIESLVHATLASYQSTGGDKSETAKGPVKAFIESVLGQESLSLTDNPNILQVKRETAKATERRNKKNLNKRYRSVREEMVTSISADNKTVVGDPIYLHLPPESVTIIHTPGDPNDHQGYLVILDRQGNPLDATAMNEAAPGNAAPNLANHSNMFNQIYNAYGYANNQNTSVRDEAMSQLYSQVVTEHLRKRMDKAGYTNVRIANTDALFRCMFSRFMQSKHTRILFLPKELVSYMTFEKDSLGYGISRLEGIKFSLGMKMAVQVSRVLASIKSAMDRRNINVRFSENMHEPPEAVFKNIIDSYINKSSVTFAVDPNVIQSQIADKSISIKAQGIPGCEDFELTNEPDQRSGTVDFDPEMLNYLDKQINNGLHVPAATMNSLSEDEYARSVTTTNLFFAMDVSIDQGIVISAISDLLRKYARYCESFHKGIYDVFPSLVPEDKKSKVNEDSNLDDRASKKKKDKQLVLPDGIDLDALIDSMTITLPHPNVAPSKAQFEALDSMVQSIGSTMDALFPDDLVGPNDELAATIRLIRAKFKTLNVRSYLESSGMSSLEIPGSDFTAILSDLSEMTMALLNTKQMLEDKSKLTSPDSSESESDGGLKGY